MSLAEYIVAHVERGACRCGLCVDAPANPEQHQPTGHTLDLVFFQVRLVGEATKEELLGLVKAEFPRWLDGQEHGYMELGSDLGDQGLGLMAIALGGLLGAWKVRTPYNMLPGVPKDLAMELAGRGLLTLIVEKTE
ncbi:MAG: hypothetical protein ABFE07_28470 [Armatimonadia bacterium]